MNSPKALPGTPRGRILLLGDGVILPDVEHVSPDLQADWRAAVASGQTVLGFRDWLAMQAQRLNQDMEFPVVA